MKRKKLQMLQYWDAYLSWGFKQNIFFQHLLRLSVTIFLLKRSKKDFHFYPPALDRFISFQPFVKRGFA